MKIKLEQAPKWAGEERPTTKKIGVAMDAVTYDVARKVGGGMAGGEAAVIGLQSEGVQLEHRNPKHGREGRAGKGRTSEAKRERKGETQRDRERDSAVGCCLRQKARGKVETRVGRVLVFGHTHGCGYNGCI